MGGAFASYKIYIDWNNDGDFSDSGEDVTSYIKQLAIVREFKQGTGMVERGKFSATLDNQDLRFSPANTGSPLSPNVKPYRPLLVQATYGGNTYTLFRGYIKSPRPSPLFSKEAFLDGVDYVDVLERTEVTLPSSGGVAIGQRIDQLVQLVVDNVSGTAWALTFDVSISSCPYWWTRNVKAAQAIEDLAQSEQGWFYFSNTGIPRFKNRHYRILNAGSAPLGTITAMAGITYDPGDDDIWNDVRVQVHPRVLMAQEEIWAHRETPAIPSWETFTVDTAYISPCLYVVTPTAGTSGTVNDIVTNTAEDGSGTVDISGYAVISYTDYGEGGRLSVQNTWSQTMYLTQCRIRGRPIVAPDTAEQKASDSASQTSYCKRTLNVDLPWQQDTLFAVDLANKTILEQKEPPAGGEIRVSINNKNEALLLLMLGLDLNSLVHVEESNTAVDGSYFVAGVTHQVSQGLKFHEATYRLEKGSGYSDWFRLDVSALDSDRLGY
ncbi:MAG: hypothetical protein FJZ89_09115 [Chloroflexi bacterium]|nr:hypothetical protein [Chloroflexota bacterium]